MTDPSGWVAPTLLCGLGNRLFQAMAAAGYAERTGRPFVFFLPAMSRGEHGCWNLFLKMFADVPIVESAPSWKILTDLSENSDEERVVTRGFFQDCALWPSPQSEIWPRVSRPIPDLQNRQRWAIHFRFGDYQILSHHQLPLGTYYRACLEIVPKDAPILFFTDSPDLLSPIIREISDLGWDTLQVSDARSEEETIYEFMTCQAGAICSNSTFAWWAAWFTWRACSLPAFRNYRAYFPTPWLKDQPAPKIFNLPFTQAIPIPTEGPTLHSFPFR